MEAFWQIIEQVPIETDPTDDEPLRVAEGDPVKVLRKPRTYLGEVPRALARPDGGEGLAPPPDIFCG